MTERDIQGLLHCHTDFSDGADTLAEMAEATRARGYEYLGVADHSRSADYAGGLSIEKVDAQHAQVDELNARFAGKFRIFKGIESDILADGSLDYPDDVLARFDFVVASVHSRFRLDTAAQTARIVRAVSNPYTTILGHLTGRLLLRREGYGVDVEEVLTACARARGCRRGQRQSASLGPGLALAPPGGRTRVHAEHQPGRAQHGGARSDPLGGGDRAQRRSRERVRAELP